MTTAFILAGGLVAWLAAGYAIARTLGPRMKQAREEQSSPWPPGPGTVIGPGEHKHFARDADGRLHETVCDCQ